MGEILKPKFGSKSENALDKSGKEIGNNVVKDKEFLNRMTEIFIFTNSLLNSDPEREKRTSRQDEIVGGYTDEELMGWINKQDEQEWKDNPHFFFAICSEARKRLDKFFYPNKK